MRNLLKRDLPAFEHRERAPLNERAPDDAERPLEQIDRNLLIGEADGSGSECAARGRRLERVDGEVADRNSFLPIRPVGASHGKRQRARRIADHDLGVRNGRKAVRSKHGAEDGSGRVGKEHFDGHALAVGDNPG